MAFPGPKEEPVARLPFWWAAGGDERGLVAAMAPTVAVNPVIKPAMLVTLKVQDTQRRVVARTMRTTDKLQWLMSYYYDTVCSAGSPRDVGCFVFDGKRLKGEQTPEDLGMKSGDQIDFFGDDLRATGGDDEAAAEEEEDEDKKPVIKMHVTVKVQDTAGRTVKRTVWVTQKLKVLMDSYYDSAPDVTYGTGKFLYDGRQLKGGQTPEELKMLEDEDDDEIVVDFFVDMLGGGGCRVGCCCCCC